MQVDKFTLLRRTGFQPCISFAVEQMLPALIFPKVYRQFLRQECDAASSVDTSHTKLMLEAIGWAPSYYQGALASDDEMIDGPLGPQQLLHQHAIPLMFAFEDRRQEVRVRIMLKIIERLGLPNDRAEKDARTAMLSDAEHWLALPMPEPSNACHHAVRALADLTAAELGITIPWNETSLTGLGIRSPNSHLTGVRLDGTVVLPSQDQHDISDLGGLAGDMLRFMCWMPVFGATHVPNHELLDITMNRYLSDRPHLLERKKAVASSLMAIQYCWTESHIRRVEAALKDHRIPWLRSQRDMYVSVLCRMMRGAEAAAPLGGWASIAAQELAIQEVGAAAQRNQLPPRQAASAVLEARLLQDALLGENWDSILRTEAPESHSEIVRRVKAQFDDPEGVEAGLSVAGAIESEGLASIGRLKPPRWVAKVCEEARRQYEDAESAFIGRVLWQSTPRIPSPPRAWSTILSGYARAVESELLFAFFDPLLGRIATDTHKHPTAKLVQLRDGVLSGKHSIGSSYARFVLSRRLAGGSESGRSPCLGEMHFLLSIRTKTAREDPGMEFMQLLQRQLPSWLRIRRNVEILIGINHYRVDAAHARKANSAREVTRDQALLGRRIMVQYLQFLVQCRGSQ